MAVDDTARAALSEARDRIRADKLHDRDERPATAGRGIHHTALISADVARTVRFYQDLVGFPLTEMFENRDLPGSTHFFFDVGLGNTLAFFDLPGVDVGPYAEVLGGLHHVAISVTPEHWERIRAALDREGVEYMIESGSSIYTRDPDGARVEFIADPLGEMYGEAVM